MKPDFFLNNLLPGNYFLTKSMEISKKTSSGTLWYTKKFIVYYYYIFLSNNINTKDDVQAIIRNFDNYIKSLPNQCQYQAKKFFYSSYPTADIRHSSFKYFAEFAGQKTFETEKKRIAYFEMAKKYYFAFLMESGGQSGVKEYIKQKIYKKSFCFSQIDDAITQYFNKQKEPLTDKKKDSIKNDYMAFLRNERQILFYYGFFHSKSSGSKDREFSSLTPIGEMALYSNFHELIAVWEHQKIKMISQPVTIDIQQIQGLKVDAKKFKINNNPYLTILYWLNYENSLTFDQYKYIVSRMRKPVNDKKDINILNGVLEQAKEKVKRFSRTGDNKDEDFTKELKKYFLGVSNDFKADCKNNPIGFCEQTRGGFVTSNEARLSTVLKFYTHLAKYKDIKYDSLFKSCEKELQRQYSLKLENSRYIIDPQIKISWDIYNIQVDKFILLGTIIAITSCQTDNSFTKEHIGSFVRNISNYFGGILNKLKINSSQLRLELNNIEQSLKKSDYSIYFKRNEYEFNEDLTSYKTRSIEDLRQKILLESDKGMIIVNGERKRNTTLIQLLREYNKQVYKKGEHLHCECCGNFTFVTNKGEMYLEYHHLIPFSLCDGLDHFLNIYAVCPTCHRKMHHIKLADKAKVYKSLSKNSYQGLSIVKRLQKLYQCRRLRSYQLEFLLADGAITENQYKSILTV